MLLAIRYTQYLSFSVKDDRFTGSVIRPVSLADAFTRSLHTFVFSSVSLKISTSIWLTATSAPSAGTVARLTGNAPDEMSRIMLLPLPPVCPPGRSSSLLQAARSHAAAQQIIILYIIRLIAC
ncbi:hypothetical protein [Parabacteroides distasonis]|uniref:hypothetical protein n=1 Tax=Parabacteroides distasonis TaxID=823 RepID=UPI0039B42C95